MSFEFHWRLLHTAQEHPGAGRRRIVSSLLNGIRRSPRVVTSDGAATPRATLKDGLVQHQWGIGLGSRMLLTILWPPRSAAACSKSFWSDGSRHVACAAEGGHYVHVKRRRHEKRDMIGIQDAAILDAEDPRGLVTWPAGDPTEPVTAGFEDKRLRRRTSTRPCAR